MPRSESYTELWVTEERQLPAELRLQVLDIKYQLYDNPEIGTAIPESKEGVREYDNGTVKILYSYTKDKDVDTFVFRSLDKSEARLFKVPRDVFVSYSHQDLEWFERINRLLAKLESAGDTTFWTDRKIKSGERWLDVIRQRLDSATAAILLTSPSFLERPFIRDEELPVLLDKADEAHRARAAAAKPPKAKKAGSAKPAAKAKPAPNASVFKLSWIPVKPVQPHQLTHDKHKEHWDRISQHQALGNPADPLAVVEPGKKEQHVTRAKLKKLERSVLDFLQTAFDGESR